MCYIGSRRGIVKYGYCVARVLISSSICQIAVIGYRTCFSVLNKTFDLESGKFCLPRVTGLTNTHTQKLLLSSLSNVWCSLQPPMLCSDK